MNMTRRELIAVTGAMAASGPALAQSYPSKPIRWIVPFPAGGNLDLTARTVVDHMSRSLGQPLVIDNKGGAGGAIGAEMAANAAPDGHTIMISATGTLFLVPLWAEKKTYSFASFTPVAMFTVVPLLFVVPAASRFTDWKSFEAHVRAHPGKVSMGHAGVGSTNQIALLRVQAASKLDFNVIPYKGSGPGLNDVLAGQIDAYTDQLSSSLAHIRAGKLRALAVLGQARLAELPEVPHLGELGWRDLECVTPTGLLVPAATPAAIVATLNQTVNKALADEAVRRRFADMGAIARPMSPEGFLAFLRSEEKAITDLARAGVLKPE